MPLRCIKIIEISNEKRLSIRFFYFFFSVGDVARMQTFGTVFVSESKILELKLIGYSFETKTKIYMDMESLIFLMLTHTRARMSIPIIYLH